MKSLDRLLLMLTSGTLSLALGGSAQAQTRVFNEDWESGTAAWRTTDATPIAVTRDTALCSSQFARETVLAGGGHTFTRAGIPVTGGRVYCLSAWVRGSTNTQPFMGINLSDAMGTPGAEHWLIGRAPYATGYGGNVTNAAGDGVWRWLTSTFTVETAATHVVIKTELFSAGSAGSADFDDIQLWEGSCPTAPQGADHVACPTSAAVCSSTGRCVACAASTDCAAPTPVCNPAANVCVGCLASTDCAAPRPLCNTARTTCVACLTNADCAGSTPVCDAAAGACIACRGDSDCGGATPACQPSGACAECSAASHALCTGARGVCDAAMGRCAQCTSADSTACMASGAGAVCASGTCGCAVDTDCGGARSGRVCDATMRLCVVGCSPAAGRNGCPDGQFCTSDDATGARVGRCTTTCNFDMDCARSMPTRPLCLSGDAGPSQCVVCRTSAECATRSDGRAVCDPATNDCVECTATLRDRCSAAGRGAACLTDGTCGCAVDGDCGDARSGRVCNAASHACVPGCRTGGNGCPDGMMCVAERCEATPVDSGVDVPAPDVAADVTAVDAPSDVAADTLAQDTGVDAARDSGADVTATDSATRDASRDATVMDTAGPPADTNGPMTALTGDGCGCRVPGRSQTQGHRGLGALALGALIAWRRRRDRSDKILPTH